VRCIEFFAGAGGAALGLEAAGIEHAALCEWDPDACATLRAAGLGPVVEGDVRDLDAIEAVAFQSDEAIWNQAGDALLDSDLEGEDWCLERERLAIEIQEADRTIDLLWSSFPCQAWSTAGKREGASDERNGWPWSVDAIDRFKPRWFLAENVYGLLTHSAEGHPDPFKCPRCYFENVILAQLQARFAHVGWWLLDAADFGVPQHRRRVIIWAGPVPLSAPRPTHGSPAEARQRDLFGRGVLPWVTMGEALGIAKNNRVIGGGRNPGKPGDRRTYRDLTDEPSTTVTAVCIGNAGPWVMGAGRSARLDQPSPTVSCVEGKGSNDAYRPPGERPKVNKASDALWLATGRRRLTVEECAILQDFPSDHPWQGNTEAKFRQVGNAVPPRLAEVVGRCVVDADARRGDS